MLWTGEAVASAEQLLTRRAALCGGGGGRKGFQLFGRAKEDHPVRGSCLSSA